MRDSDYGGEGEAIDVFDVDFWWPPPPEAIFDAAVHDDGDENMNLSCEQV